MQSDEVKSDEVRIVKNALVEVVAALIRDTMRKGIYDSVKRSRGRKEALDWIGHCVKASLNAGGILGVVNMMAEKLSLQVPVLPSEALSVLEQYEEMALDLLDEEWRIIVFNAARDVGIVRDTKERPKTSEAADMTLDELEEKLRGDWDVWVCTGGRNNNSRSEDPHRSG